MTNRTPGYWFVSAIWHLLRRCRRDLPSWDLSKGPLSIFPTSLTTSLLACFIATTLRGYHEPTTNWNVALALHASTSDEPLVDAELSLVWSFVVPSVSSLP